MGGGHRGDEEVWSTPPSPHLHSSYTYTVTVQQISNSCYCKQVRYQQELVQNIVSLNICMNTESLTQIVTII